MPQRVVTLQIPRKTSDEFGVSPDPEAAARQLSALVEDDDWRIASIVPLIAGFGARTIEPSRHGQLLVEGATAHGFSWTDSLLIVLEQVT